MRSKVYSANLESDIQTQNVKIKLLEEELVKLDKILETREN